MIFGKRTERHQARKAEGQEKAPESDIPKGNKTFSLIKSDICRSLANAS
jgi:hypothetical protein